MCVVSMVHDHYNNHPGWPWVRPTQLPGPPLGQPWDSATISEMRKLIDEYREALEAAKRVDVLTRQPDCEDPEKAKLVERVAELERQLNAIREAAK